MQPGAYTTHEVLKKCDIESPKTLTRWHQQGLIPPPVIQTHPNGRGKISYWPIWIMERIREVKARAAKGETLKQIAQTLGQDWVAEERRYLRQKPNFAARLANMIRDEARDNFAKSVAEIVHDYLRGIGIERPGSIYDDLRDEFHYGESVEEIVRLIRSGHNPALVLIGRDVKAVPDFLVSSTLADQERPEEPLLIIPIRKAFINTFADAEPELPKESRFAPALRLVDRAGKKDREHKYRRKGPWEFILED